MKPEMKDELGLVQSVWETLAQNDPLWAILSEPEKKGRKWDVDEFFEIGRTEVDAILKTLEEAGRPVLKRGAALDFGCGVGRLSQRLADYFDRVTGVDISTNMIALARKFNRHGGRVEYVHNNLPDLSLFANGQFDFVYSNIVLQHMEPRHAIAYMREFFRVTRPGGSIVFQIPSHLNERYLPHDYSRTPLDRKACRARIEVLALTEKPVCGAKIEARMSVTNSSACEWTQHPVNQLNLGNHWLTPVGETVLHDDGRARLPGRVRSGENVEVALTMTAPDRPGAYVLEFDVVQEGVRWFKNVGSTAAEIPVEVVPKPAHSIAHSASGAPAHMPDFMMNGVRKAAVLSLIGQHGGTLVALEEHVTEWHSYKYFVGL